METTPSPGRRHPKAHGPLTIWGVGGHGLLFPVPARRPTNRVPSAPQQRPGRCERPWEQTQTVPGVIRQRVWKEAQPRFGVILDDVKRLQQTLEP